MIRKLLVIAAAVAVPTATMAGVTAITGAGIAAAAKPAPVPVTCSLSGTVTFNKPGLYPTGSITKMTTATTKTAITPGGASACGTKTIKSAIEDQYYFDTVGSLLSGPADILAALAAGVKTQDNGNNFVLVPTSASSILPGDTCGASEVGFAISGNVTGVLGVLTAFSMNVCLSGDSDPSTTNNFFGGLTGGVAIIASALLDPATSSVALS